MKLKPLTDKQIKKIVGIFRSREFFVEARSKCSPRKGEPTPQWHQCGSFYKTGKVAKSIASESRKKRGNVWNFRAVMRRSVTTTVRIG